MELSMEQAVVNPRRLVTGQTLASHSKAGLTDSIAKITTVETHMVKLPEMEGALLGSDDARVLVSGGPTVIHGNIQNGQTPGLGDSEKLSQSLSSILDVFEDMQTNHEIKIIRRKSQMTQFLDGHSSSSTCVDANIIQLVVALPNCIEEALRGYVEHA